MALSWAVPLVETKHVTMLDAMLSCLRDIQRRGGNTSLSVEIEFPDTTPCFQVPSLFILFPSLNSI